MSTGNDENKKPAKLFFFQNQKKIAQNDSEVVLDYKLIDMEVVESLKSVNREDPGIES